MVSACQTCLSWLGLHPHTHLPIDILWTSQAFTVVCQEIIGQTGLPRLAFDFCKVLHALVIFQFLFWTLQFHKTSIHHPQKGSRNFLGDGVEDSVRKKSKEKYEAYQEFPEGRRVLEKKSLLYIVEVWIFCGTTINVFRPNNLVFDFILLGSAA